MKKLIVLVLALACVLGMAGCSDAGRQKEVSATNDNENFSTNTNSTEQAKELLAEGNVVKIDVSSLPEGYNYSFNGEDAKEIVGYLSNLKLQSNFNENPNTYNGMTWVISLEYENGDALTIYHFGNMFIRSEKGSWYKMTYEEASRFGSLLDELNATKSQNTQSETDYLIPDYDTANNLHCDEFLEKLKNDGYIRGGEKDYNYNTDNITRIVNITPKSISDETSDIEVFCVNDAHCFLMVNHTIYRYDTFGGYHHQLCLWDYDSNGTKDIVSYNTSGSGLPYMSVDIFDLTSFEGIQVITRMTLNEPEFSFECKNGVIYIDGEELTYSNGSFHCDSFNKYTQ